MDLDIELKQSLIITPKMIQAMEILQKSAQELSAYIEETTMENPVLEYDGAREEWEAPGKILCRKLQWLADSDLENRAYYQQEAGSPDDLDFNRYGRTDGETLFGSLMLQLKMLPLEPQVLSAAVYLAGCLNENGWLDEPIEAIASEAGCDLETLRKALKALQSLEPAGMGARSLSECLCLQLERHHRAEQLALSIARDHLVLLAHNRYDMIAHILEVPEPDVRAACDLIRSLEPRPGAGFSPPEAPQYITPDVIVVNRGGVLELIANDAFIPKLSLSRTYCRMLEESEDARLTEYLRRKFRHAQWVMQCIEERRSLLLSCARHILASQRAFFLSGPGHLKALKLSDVAKRIGVHESTVSRAIRNKYLQCASGTYPLGYFFTRGIGHAGDTDVTADEAKAALIALIAREDPARPLSDRKLCEILGEKGIALSRRTVAKYRTELGIAGTPDRKRK